MSISIPNPFKKPAVSLVDQLAAKQDELEGTAVSRAEHARELAELAAAAKTDSDVAAHQALAVNEAHHILHAAGVSL